MILTEPKLNFDGQPSLLKYQIGEYLRIKIDGKWHRWTVDYQIKPGEFHAKLNDTDPYPV